MAWGAPKGVDDLLVKLRTDANLTSLVILRNRRFGVAEATQFAGALASNSTLTELFASGHGVGVEGAAAFGKALVTNTALSALSLGDNGMSDEGVTALVHGGLHKNTGLVKLDLEYKSVTRGDHIGHLLQHHIALQDLRLGRNRIGNDGLVALCQGLRASTALTHLDLSSNAFGQEGVAALTTSLPTTLIGLNLSGNALCGSAGHSLFTSLAAAQNTTLATLKLRDCALDATAAAALMLWSQTDPEHACYARHTALSSLDLTGNADLGASGAWAAVQCSSRLSWLSICGLCAGDEGAGHVAANAPPTLTHLDASRNGIGPDGACALLALLQLMELRLFNNSIGDDGAAAVAGALKRAAEAGSCKMATLDLGANSLTHEGIVVLLEAVRPCNFLSVIELGGNTVDEAAESAIRALQDVRPDVDVAFRTNGGGLGGAQQQNNAQG
eukprot:TRINITY_DN2097_c0_g1_i1.p1 TRINITY_DN2097_c0_g1~~TRINITY_DN2097_c0_g1_i1.p1  ORF type:complete len:454 (+),score=73.47 TRINITY_DN2097_c0_g1_i1:34-1362(+)